MTPLPRSGRRWLVATLLAAVAVSLGLAWWALVGHAESRYTRSELISLSSVHEGDAQIWFTEWTVREIWIAPDGSGRIREHGERTELVNPAQQTLWETVTAGRSNDHDRAFQPAGLTYYTDGQIADALAAIKAKGAGGAALRSIASLLAETAPSSETVETARAISAGLPGVTSTTDGTLVTASGDAPFGGGTRVEITFDSSKHTFVRERWLGLQAEPDLALTTPFLVFDRMVKESIVVPGLPQGTAEP